MNQDEMRDLIKAERDAMRDPEEVIADETTITVYGMRYSRELFRAFGTGLIGTLLRIEKREDGVITVRTYPPGEQVMA